MNFDVLIKTVFIFYGMLLLTRILGKKQTGHLTYFNYVTGIVFGSIAGSVIVEKQLKLIEGLVGLAVWTILTLVTEYISYKFRWTRTALGGQPTIVIKEGKIMQKAMSKTRLDVDDLMMLLRNKGASSIADVSHAIFECNGQISIIKNDQQQPITKKDLNIPPSPSLQLPGALIIKGKILKKNLRELNINEQWLTDQLKANGISSVKQVFYAELKADRTIYLNKF